MTLTAREHRILEQIAVGLRVTDPALAAQLAHWPTGPGSGAWAIVAAATALAAMIGGLPLTLASPLWGCCLSIGGFIALAAATFNLIAHGFALPRLPLHHLRYLPGQHPPGDGNL